MQHTEFDTIYHEHYTYLSLLSAERLLARHGLKVFEVEELPTHGGSLRYYIVPSSRTDVVEGEGLIRMRAAENAFGLGELDTYKTFARQIAAPRWPASLPRRSQSSAQKVAAYGAAAKGSTLLNYCGINSDHIAMVADRNTYKQGRLLPGSHIPILPPSALRELRPDYVLILEQFFFFFFFFFLKGRCMP